MWLRLSASIGMLSTARWSAMKKASNLARLQPLGEALQMGEVEIGVGIGAGIAPGAGVETDRAHEGAEMEVSRHHFTLLLRIEGPGLVMADTTRR